MSAPTPPTFLAANLSACHRCPRRQGECSGPCACTVDGRDILHHAETGECPLGRFPPAPARGLGDTVAKIAAALGADKLAAAYEQLTGKDCGCAKRREKLNELVPYER